MRKFCFLLCLLAGTSEAATYTVKVGQGQVKVEWYADGVVREDTHYGGVCKEKPRSDCRSEGH